MLKERLFRRPSIRASSLRPNGFTRSTACTRRAVLARRLRLARLVVSRRGVTCRRSADSWTRSCSTVPPRSRSPRTRAVERDRGGRRRAGARPVSDGAFDSESAAAARMASRRARSGASAGGARRFTRRRIPSSSCSHRRPRRWSDRIRAAGRYPPSVDADFLLFGVCARSTSALTEGLVGRAGASRTGRAGSSGARDWQRARGDNQRVGRVRRPLAADRRNRGSSRGFQAEWRCGVRSARSPLAKHGGELRVAEAAARRRRRRARGRASPRTRGGAQRAGG